MAVILNRNFRMFCLDVCYDLPQRMRTADAGHILYTDFIRSEFDQFHRHLGVIFDRMDGRVGDAQRALRDHPCCFRISDGRSNVADIVQSAECAGDICPLCFFYLVEQLANVVRYGTHTQAVQRSVQHVGLYAGLMERLRPFAYGSVWVFTE